MQLTSECGDKSFNETRLDSVIVSIGRLIGDFKFSYDYFGDSRVIYFNVPQFAVSDYLF